MRGLGLLLRLAVVLAAASSCTGGGDASEEDLYARLGVTSTADAREIKKAYRAQSLEWHPDKATARGVDPELAQQQFVEVARAYEVLSDPEQKTAYDRCASAALPAGCLPSASLCCCCWSHAPLALTA